MAYTADFETTTDENDCRVWAWGICEIGNTDNTDHGNSIDTFMQYIEKAGNKTYYFRNLKFDGVFILSHLFENGFKHVTDRKNEATRTFSTLISDKGQWYSIKIVFEKKGKKTKYVKIYDSLKIIPLSIDETARAFGLPLSKLTIDYKKFRPIGYIPTPEEVEYVLHDVIIDAMALNVLFSQGLTKMTQGSNALFDFKQIFTEKRFKRCFPVPDYDEDVRQSFKGGFTYLNPCYKDVDMHEGLVLDVNSLYPWVLRDCPLPYDEPIFFTGKYESDPLYNVYVQMLSCQFELKEGYLPTIQLKHNLSFVPTEYITSSNKEEVTMCLTSVDLELFLEHYEVINPVYHSGWKFKSTTGLFAEYIDKWMNVKIESSINGNKGMRTLSKLMLNSLFGKFALSPKVASKIPYYDNGVVKYQIPTEEYTDSNGKKRKRIKYEYREPIYIPVGTFVTAWARHKTITSAQKVYDMFIYADTDSLHLNLPLPPELSEMSNDELEKLTTADLKRYGLNLPEGFDVDPVALGAWKIESRFTRARFIRSKCYIEDWNKPETWNTDRYDKDLLNITCAGMPKACYPHVTWENFHEGSSYAGKLQPKHVAGGIILKDIDFTIQRTH